MPYTSIATNEGMYLPEAMKTEQSAATSTWRRSCFIMVARVRNQCQEEMHRKERKEEEKSQLKSWRKEKAWGVKLI